MSPRVARRRGLRRVSWHDLTNSNLDQAWDSVTCRELEPGAAKTPAPKGHLHLRAGVVVASSVLRTSKRVKSNQVGEASLMSEQIICTPL